MSAAVALEALTGALSQSLYPGMAFRDTTTTTTSSGGGSSSSLLSSACTICNKRFRNKESLMVHRNIHSEAHKCKHCGKGFACRSKLHTHLTTHEPYLKIPCTLCNKAFGGRSELNRHYTVAHRVKDRTLCGDSDINSPKIDD